MNVYIFVMAAVLAIIPIIVIFNVNIKKIKENPRSYQKIQKSFFIGAALSKIVPIILLIFGIIKITPVSSPQLLIVPALIILGLIGFATFYILSKRNETERPEAASAVKTLSTIALPHVFSIPIMALFFLLMML